MAFTCTYHTGNALSKKDYQFFNSHKKRQVLSEYTYRNKMFYLFCVVNYSFQNIPNLFGQPVVCLLSPERAPPTMQGQLSTKGPLFEYTWKCM